MTLIDPGADWAGAYEQEKRWREVEQEEKQELELEIERHHRDFEKIRNLLTQMEGTVADSHGPGHTGLVFAAAVERWTRELRNIVG